MATKGPFVNTALTQKATVTPAQNGSLNAAQQAQQTPALPANPVDALLQGLHLPALPGVDQLLAPINSIISGFGTGTFSSVSPVDTMKHSSSLLDALVTSSEEGLGYLDTIWTSAAKNMATISLGNANASGSNISAQGTDIATITADAAGTVQDGYASLVGIAESFAATAVASAPVLLTPPGQAALMSLASESISQAMAVVSKTQATLATQISKLTSAGITISVPNIDTSVVAEDVLKTVWPSMKAVGTFITDQMSSATTAAQKTQVAAPAGTPASGTPAKVVAAAMTPTPTASVQPNEPVSAQPNSPAKPLTLTGNGSPTFVSAAAASPTTDAAASPAMAGIAPAFPAGSGEEGIRSRHIANYPNSTRLIDDDQYVMPAVLGAPDVEDSADHAPEAHSSETDSPESDPHDTSSPETHSPETHSPETSEVADT